MKNHENAEKRTRQKLNKIRKNIGQLVMFEKGKLKNPHTIHHIQKTYSNKRNISKACEQLKQEASILGKKIAKNKEIFKTQQQNTLFENSPSLFLQSINENNNSISQDINFDNDKCLKFWKDIWETTLTPIPNKNSKLFSTIETHFEDHPQQDKVVISENVLKHILSKASNFKAPGPDKI